MNEDIKKKIESCKALQGVTIEDIIKGEHFRRNLAAYWKAQQEDRQKTIASFKAMHKLGGKMKLPAHAIDHFLGKSANEMADLTLLMIQRKSGLSANDRKYLDQLSTQAVNLTVAEIVCEEFPELTELLIPKNKSNDTGTKQAE